MKVIYLDIDGVLNSYKDHVLLDDIFRTGGVVPPSFVFYDKGNYIEKHKLKLLHMLIDRYDAKVVVVSSWVCYNREAFAICEFLNIPYHSDPLYSGGGTRRGRTIVEHALKHGINDYIIIDDSLQMYEDTERLIHIDGHVGITKEDISKVEDLWPS